jgi:hypothetical protein
MAKNIALTKIESHEKLCRIMQKQTYDKINSLEKQICRIETILLTSVGALITGMGGVNLYVNHPIDIHETEQKFQQS